MLSHISLTYFVIERLVVRKGTQAIDRYSSGHILGSCINTSTQGNIYRRSAEVVLPFPCPRNKIRPTIQVSIQSQPINELIIIYDKNIEVHRKNASSTFDPNCITPPRSPPQKKYWSTHRAEFLDVQYNRYRQIVSNASAGDDTQPLLYSWCIVLCCTLLRCVCLSTSFSSP